MIPGLGTSKNPVAGDGVLWIPALAGMATSARQLNLTPFSLRYLIAPGWNGTGEADAFWFSSLMLAASLCTAISSSRFSKIVLTML